MAGRCVIWLVVLAVWTGCARAGGEADEPPLEQSVCGLQEPVMFWLWSGLAGSPDAARVRGLPNVEDIAFDTRDGRVLRGYRLRARRSDKPPSAAQGCLLVMQGNAMLADRILGEFTGFADAGLDVYVYDYRGYGRSGGSRRLKAMVSDYAEISNALRDAGCARRFVYAMSFGGIVYLDGLALHDGADRVVIDSTPARLSDYGCPQAYDPVNHLPADCGDFLLIAGEKDGVVTSSMSRDLLEQAQQCGARVRREADFAHPFMDRDRAVHRRRLELIEAYLLR